MRPANVAVGAAALILTAALWGSNHVIARAMHDTVPLTAMVFWRWALALLVLVPIALSQMQREREPLRRDISGLAFGGAIGVGIFSILLIGGAYQGLATDVSIINATTPAWVAVIAWLEGRSLLGPRGWLGLALAFLGTVVIILRGDLAALVTVDIHIGSLWSLLGAMTFAWFSLRVRDWSREISSLSLTTITAWFGFILVMAPVYLLWLAVGGEVVAFRTEDETQAWASVIYVALGPTLLGNVCYLFGVSVVGPQRAAAFLYLSPIFAALLSVALLGETLHLFHFAGFALIVIGLVVVNTSAPPKRSAAEE